MRYHILAATLLATTAAACAMLPHGPGDPDVILEDEIAAAGARNGYEVVERLRPRWLRSGPPRSTRLETVILVYVDGSILGGTETLRDLPVESIVRLHVLDSADAGQLPGLGSRHVERVIMVSTRRR
jgi:hypothetical protein